MKNIILSVITLFILTNCSIYKEPKMTENVSILILKENKDRQRDTCSSVKLDGQILNRSHSSTTRIKVIPGKHEIKYEPTIYYSQIAKHSEVETFTLDFKPNKVYTIEVIPHVSKLEKDDDDVTGTLKVFENKKLILNKDLLLEHSIMRMRMKPENGSTDPMVLDSIVYQAVLSSTL